jgi:hypothetical protein
LVILVVGRVTGDIGQIEPIVWLQSAANLKTMAETLSLLLKHTAINLSSGWNL